MQPALAASLAKFESNGRDQILVFLTDGEVGNTDSLLNLIERSIGRVRLFPFGIGGVPNAALIQKMAERGNGQARFITNDGEVERELTDLFATLDAPVLTDVRLSLVDVQGGAIEYASFPERLPDVFLGRPLQSVFRWKQGMPAGAVINGQENGRAVQYRIALNPTAMRGDGLEKEFGRRLYDDTAILLRRATTEVERAMVRKEMLDTALQFQLVTELTSRVAADLQVARAPGAPLVSQHVGQYAVSQQRSGSAIAATSNTGDVIMLHALASRRTRTEGIWLGRRARARRERRE
jgi:Ca-activated chloride channel family protein